METSSLTFHEQRIIALSNRAERLIGWLARTEYANYEDANSTYRLTRLIDLIIWAFEMSLSPEEWKSFLQQFKEAKSIATGSLEDGEELRDEKANYNNAITHLVTTLQSYKDHMSAMRTPHE